MTFWTFEYFTLAYNDFDHIIAIFYFKYSEE